MARKNNEFLFTKEIRGPRRDTTGQIKKAELENYVNSFIQLGEVDVDAILNGREFTKDELRFVKLVIARYALISGNKKIGERLIREVEESKDKGTDVFFYLEQIKKNKTLYSEKARHNPTYIKMKQDSLKK